MAKVEASEFERLVLSRFDGQEAPRARISLLSAFDSTEPAMGAPENSGPVLAL